MSPLALILGTIVGFSLGLTGGGGAIFAVPLLVYDMTIDPRQERMAEDLRKVPNASGTAASLLARCVSLVEKDTLLPEKDRKALAKKYADRSQELAREADKRSQQRTADDEKPKQ